MTEGKMMTLADEAQRKYPFPPLALQFAHLTGDRRGLEPIVKQRILWMLEQAEAACKTT